jgi:hypothetical protein
MSVNYLDKGNKSGTLIGCSTTSLVGFYGIQPVDQPASLTVAVSTLTYVTATTPLITIWTSLTSSGSGFGFAASAEFGGFVRALTNTQLRLIELEARLAEVGLIAGGTSVVTATAQPFDYVGSGGTYSGGQCLGQATSSKISFFGVLPCDQPAAVTTCSATAYSTCSVLASLTEALIGVNTTISAATSGDAGGNWGHSGNDSNALHSMVAMVASVMTRLGEVENNLTEVGILPGGTAKTTAVDYDFLDKGSDTGTIMGANAYSKIAFWAGTPCKQAAALTTAIATLSYATAAAPVYVIASGVSATAGFGAKTADDAATIAFVVQNVQKRMGEIEAALDGLGLQAT